MHSRKCKEDTFAFRDNQVGLLIRKRDMMKKIKVAFFSDMLIANYDGFSRTIYNIINRIPSEQFEFLFICGKGPKGEFDHEFIEIPTMPIPSNSRYKMALPYFVKGRIENTLDKFKPDIVHFSNPSPLGKLAVDYAKENNIPLVSIYHTHYISYVKYYFRNFPQLIPFAERRVLKLTKYQYDLCDILYVPVKDIINQFKHYGYRTDNCVIWDRGMDCSLFHPGKRDKRLLRNITYNNLPNVLFASRIVWEKNLETLIKIYQAKKEIPFNMIIAGDGNALSDLKNLMPSAHFLGNLSHEKLSQVYASSDIFLFPSDTETYGNVLIEAMASGLPIVSANSGGPVNILDDGKRGFLVNSHNPEEYLDKIELLLSDDEVYYRMREEGLAFAKSRDWDKLIHRYFNDLLYLIDQKNKRYA